MESPQAVTTLDTWAIVAPISQAQSIRQQLESLKFWDDGHKLDKIGNDHIAIPIQPSCLSLVQELLPQYDTICANLPASKKQNAKRTSPSQILRTRITTVLQENNLPNSLLEEVPKKWERHGDLVILQAGCFLSSQWKILGPELWQLVSESLSCRRVARSSAVGRDGFRSSQVELLHGDNGWVTSVDNGVRYSFDATKCMFSSGNITEKLRVAQLDCRDKTVVDLYAGIGYFSLPYLIHGGAMHLHACEWNPAAVEALRYNLMDNGVEDRCTVHEGDNRKLQLASVADVVNLGLIPSSEPGWPVAVQVLSLRGGVLRVHGNVTDVTVSRGNSGSVRQRNDAQQNVQQYQNSIIENCQTNKYSNQTLQTDKDLTNRTLQMDQDSNEYLRLVETSTSQILQMNTFSNNQNLQTVKELTNDILQEYKESANQNLQSAKDLTNQNLQSTKYSTNQNLQSFIESTNENLQTNKDTTNQNLQPVKNSTNQNGLKIDQTIHSHKDLIKPMQNQNFATQCPQDSTNSMDDTQPQVCPQDNNENLQEIFSQNIHEYEQKQPSKRDRVINACNVWSKYVTKRILNLLQEKKGGTWIVGVTHVEIVKPYAPHIWHVVLDLDCRPQS